MSTALAVHSQFPDAATWDSMKSVANLLARSEAVRDCFRAKPENVMVALMVSRDLGISPVLALQKGYVVNGTFDLEALVKLSIIQERLPEFDYDIEEWDVVMEKGVAVSGICRVKGGREGKLPKTVEYTIQMAKDAKIFKDVWLTHPKDMLFYKAVKRLINMTAGGALYRMPSVLRDEDDPQGPSFTTGTASEATVVMDAPTMAAPEPVEVKSIDIPVDELGRLMGNISTLWCLPSMPEHKNARGKWLKSHAEVITRVCNLFYEEKGEAKVVGFGKVDILDYPRISAWLEARGAKGEVAADATTEGTDAPPAVAAELPEDEDDNMEIETGQDEVIVPAHERLKNAGLDAVVSLLLSLRLESKGAVRYVEEQNGKFGLTHLPMLTALGYDKGQWLHNIQKDSNKWDLLCRAIVDECHSKHVALNL